MDSSYGKFIRVVLFVVGLMALGLIVPSYERHIIIMIMFYTVLGQGLNILYGYAGQMSFGNGVFVGIGAYTSSLLWLWFDVTPWIGMLLGGLMCVVVALMIGVPTLKLKGYYFGIASMGFLSVIRAFFLRWEFVYAATGISFARFRPISNMFIDMLWWDNTPYYYIILGFFIAAVGFVYKLENSKLGIYLKAIKQDELMTESLGIDVANYKRYAFILSAFMTGLMGTFYAFYIQYFNPDTIFGWVFNLQVMLIVIIGGLGVWWGPIIGAIVVQFINTLSRIYFAHIQGLNGVVTGLLIVILSVYSPEGLSLKIVQKLNLTEVLASFSSPEKEFDEGG